ncbi:hypothetical protein S245_025363, partial [Arachis hypogaea]
NKEKNTPRHSIDHSVINEEVIRINNNRPNITTPYINKDFNAEYNTGLRKWYFTKYFGKKTIETRKEFYDYLTKNKINLYFFDWFKNYFQDFKKEFCPLIESQYPQKETIKLQFQSPDVIKLRTNVKADIEELKEKLKSISQEKTVINIIEINKMTYKNQYYPKLRNYYQRPISTDVSLEERIQLVQNSFIGSDLCKTRKPNTRCYNNLNLYNRKNYLRDLNIFKDRIGTQLMNLRYPTMSEYRWYKDVFISK